MTIKIAFVIDELLDERAGGSEAQLVLLLRGLDRRRFSPYLVCLEDSAWLRRGLLDVPTLVFDARSVRTPSYWRAIRAFGRFCRDERIDVVQTCFTEADIFGAIARRVSRRPSLVWSRRNIGHAQSPSTLRLLRLLGRRTRCYLANSKAAGSHAVRAEGVDPGRVVVIANGMDLSRFERITPDVRARQRAAWGLRESDRVVGIVANHRAVKNIHGLMESVARLAPEFPALRLVSVGDGPFRPELERLRDALGLRDRVTFAGHSLDPVACLAAFDYAALVSTHESMSNSLMEYMCAGLPIVASDVGGNGELVEHGRTGLLYDVSRSDLLDASLRRLLSDDAFARTLGGRARDAAFARFGGGACIRAHEDLYERLAARPGRR